MTATSSNVSTRKRNTHFHELDSLLPDVRANGFPLFMYNLNEPGGQQQSLGKAPQFVLARETQSTLSSTWPLSANEWKSSKYQCDPLRRLFSNGSIKFNKTLPIVWENQKGRLDITKDRLSLREHDYLVYCYQQGIRTGVNIPILNPGNILTVVSFFSDISAEHVRDNPSRLAQLFLSAHHINAAVFDKVRREQIWGMECPITNRELECMQLAAQGKNATEIAQILGLSGLTVRGYFKNVAQKLNTTTRVQALAKLCSMGLLTL